MAAESDFLVTLKAVKHWRMQGTTLVLEGDRASLEWAPADSTPR
jgi:heat shock protein HslJ